MTHPDPTDDSSLQTILDIYDEHPMHEGDAVLLFLDGKVCLEIERLATEWDEVLRHNTAHILSETGRQVAIAIARRNARLLPSDFRLWHELRTELQGTEVELLPLLSMPAA